MADQMTFQGSRGARLAGRLELPEGRPRAFAIFAHCFTCSKDVVAASRVSRALSREGIGVLRFDFTGLGNSDGDFANTNFSSNVADLVAAARHLENEYEAPQLLIGHSLGGAAVLRAALEIPSTRAVVTIGAPASPDHVAHLLDDEIDEIRERGEACVTLGGRSFTIQKQFLDDIDEHGERRPLEELDAAALIFHSPQDEVVHIDNAAKLYRRLRHPKSFVSLDGADHLLTDRKDSEYVASVLAAWASRYLPERTSEHRPETEEGEVFVAGAAGSFRTHVEAGSHTWTADEPAKVGGTDRGPSPYDMLLAALGACTSMTLHMYAKRKKLQLDEVRVRLRHERVHEEDCEGCDEQPRLLDRISRTIGLSGDLDEQSRKRLIEIADRCPVHRTLEGEVRIETDAE